VFSALDAAGVSDGIAVERDVRPAEERLTLDALLDDQARKKLANLI
jgi:hypothetical protein